MNEFSHREFDAILRSDLCYFAERWSYSRILVTVGSGG